MNLRDTIKEALLEEGHHHEEDSEAESHYLEAAQYTGPKEEDSILWALLCPFRNQQKDAIEKTKEDIQEDKKLKLVIEEAEEDPSILWFGLFADLLVVAIVVRFADQFKTAFEANGSGEFAIMARDDRSNFFIRIALESVLYFFAFFTVWLELTQANARFFNIPGLIDDGLFFIYLLGITFMSVQMKSTQFLLDEKFGFLVGILISYTSMGLLQIVYYYFIPAARNYCARRLKAYGFTLITLITGVVVIGTSDDPDSQTMEWFTVAIVIISCGTLFIVALVSFRVDDRFENFTLEYVQERFGIFIMIVTGESVLALLVGDKSSPLLTLSAAASGASSVVSSAGAIGSSFAASVATSPFAHSEATSAAASVAHSVAHSVATSIATSGDIASSVASSVATSDPGHGHHLSKALGSVIYAYNHHHYPIYVETGAFFQGSNELQDYAGVLMAFTTMYIVKNIYFDAHVEGDNHALANKGSPGSVAWVFAHFPLAYFLLGCGCGFRLLFTTIRKEEAPETYRLILGISLCATMFCMFFMRACHKGFSTSWVGILFRIPVALLIPVGSEIFANSLEFMGWCLGIVFINWMFDLTIMPMLEHGDDDHQGHHHEPSMGGAPHEDHEDYAMYSAQEQKGTSVVGKEAIRLENQNGARHHRRNRAQISMDGVGLEHDSMSFHESKGCCGWLWDICGLEDKEYEGAFTGPEFEGDPIQLCSDVLFCNLWEYASPMPAHFPNHYKEKLRSGHDHGHAGGHGTLDTHDDHGGHGHEDADSGSGHGWFGEFTDLIYVAIIIKFADQMKYKQTTMQQADDELVEDSHSRVRIYVEGAILFGAFFVTWLELTHCLIRFRNMPGIFDDLMYFFYLIGVVFMAIQMNHLEYLLQRRMAFCLWYSFTLVMLIILHAQFSKIDTAEQYSKKRVVVFGLSALISLMAAFQDIEGCMIMLTASYCLVLWVSVNSYRFWAEQQADAHEQHHYIERFGLLVMITTGESILALILTDADQTLEYYGTLFFAFSTTYLLKSIYFGSHSELPECHALAEGQVPGSVLWVVLHAPLAFCLTCCGVGFKMILPHAHEEDVHDVARYTLGISLCCALMCMYVIRAAHNKFVLPLRSVILRFGAALFIPFGATFLTAPISFVTFCFVMVFVNFVLDYIFTNVLTWEIDDDFMASKAAKNLMGTTFQEAFE